MRGPIFSVSYAARRTPYLDVNAAGNGRAVQAPGTNAGAEHRLHRSSISAGRRVSVGSTSTRHSNMTAKADFLPSGDPQRDLVL